MNLMGTDNTRSVNLQQNLASTDPIPVLLLGERLDQVELGSILGAQFTIEQCLHLDKAVLLSSRQPFEVIVVEQLPHDCPPLQAIALLHQANPRSLKILSTTPFSRNHRIYECLPHQLIISNEKTVTRDFPPSRIKSVSKTSHRHTIEEPTGLPLETMLAIDPAGKIQVILANRLNSPEAKNLRLIGYCCPFSEALTKPTISGRGSSSPSKHSRKTAALDCEDDMPFSILSSLQDLASHKKALNELELRTADLQRTNKLLDSLASHDPLTGVLNRRGFERVLEVHTSNLRRKGTHTAVILADCDDFKQINHTFGHAAGDRVLHSMADQLRKELRPGDQVARIGGDEFLILLSETRLTEAMIVAERLRQSVREVSISHSQSALTISTGMSMSVQSLPNGRCTLADLLELGRDGLQLSKKNGKNRVSSAKHSPKEHADIRVLTRNWSRYSALVQPIHRLHDNSIIGYECLSRGPTEALRMPDTFFMVATQSGNLNAVDKRCLQTCIESCRTLSQKLDNNLDQDLTIHFNLFPSTLCSMDIDHLLDMLKSVASPSHFCLELNEKYFVGDPSYIEEKIKTLRAHGIKIALDEIGFGRSSLEALILLEPDIVKLDRNLVRDCTQDNAKKRILTRLVRVVDSLNISIIATGIESKSDLAWIRQLGAQFGQGYYWEHPHPLP